jgi:hypothetical protein
MTPRKTGLGIQGQTWMLVALAIILIAVAISWWWRR